MLDKSIYKDYEVYSWVSYPLLGVAAYLLCINASVDWIHYKWLYGSYVENQSWGEMIDAFSFTGEFLFNWPSKFVGGLIGYEAFIFLMTVALLTLKLFFYQKLSEQPWLTIFFYTCFYLFLLEGTVLRVAYATALIIPAIYLLSHKKPVWSLVLIMLASQLHFSTIVFLIMFPLFYSKVFFAGVVIVFVLSPLLMLFQISLFEIINAVANIINPKYVFYSRESIVENQNSTGLFFYFLGLFYFLNLFAFYTLRKTIFNDRTMRVLLGLGLTGVILMCSLHTHVAPATRLAELLMITLPLYLTAVYARWTVGPYKVAGTSLVLFAMLYAMVRFIYLYPTLVPFIR